MKKPDSSVESELHISPRPVIALLLITAVVLIVVAQYQLDLSGWSRLSNLALLCAALSGSAWAVDHWQPRIGRWFILAGLAALLCLANRWLEVPGLLTLLAVPVGLAAALIGLSAAVIVAVGETLLLMALQTYPSAGVDQPDGTMALTVIWTMVGTLYAAQKPVYERSQWLESYVQRARSRLEEARRHRAELAQALDDLAHANRQLALMNERITALRRSAEEAQKAKVWFVARVSHEFRTPLNMILGLVDLMAETPEMYDTTLSPRMREDLQVVHRNCEHLSRMINDVLDLTRVEADRLVLHREQVNLGTVVDGAVSVIRPLLDNKCLALHTEIAEDLPEIYCDRTRIEQVLLNLMSNAARYTGEGSITVTIVYREQHVLCSVADTGPGIRPEDAQHIFEPFYQGTGDFWQDKKGSGLGLSISKQFIELHGGRMWLEGESGIGTTVAFELPVSPSTASVIRPGHQINAEWIWRERRSRYRFPDFHYRPRFILCDSGGELQAVLAPYADEAELVPAGDLAQVAQALQMSPAHAVILNVSSADDLWPMLETAQKTIPGMLLLCCCMSRTMERAVDLGVLGYLMKPVTRADLKGALQAAGQPVRQVLVVDDDPDALAVFSRMLRACDQNVDVVTASSGRQALEVLQIRPPDLMLLDVVMPDMDGWTALESMARTQGRGQVPTFLVSAQNPTDQPPISHFLMATTDGGLSADALFRCSFVLSALMLPPGGKSDPASE